MKLIFTSAILLIIGNILLISVIIVPNFLNLGMSAYLLGLTLFVLNSFLIVYLLFIYLKQKKQISAILEKVDVSTLDSNFEKMSISLYNDLLLINNFPHILCIKDGNGCWLQAHPNYLKLLELQEVDFIGKTDKELALSSENLSLMFERNIIQDRSAWKLQQVVKKTIQFNSNEVDHYDEWDISTTPVFLPQERRFRLFVTGQKIEQEPVKYIQTNNNQSTLLEAVFETSDSSFVILDTEFNIIHSNSAFVDFSLFLGYAVDMGENQFISHISLSNHTKKFSIAVYAHCLKYEGEPWVKDFNCTTKLDEKVVVRVKLKPIIVGAKKIENYFVTLEDVTSFKKQERAIIKVTRYDNLTKLFNRAMFMDHLAQFLVTAPERKITAIILFIDLDKFKIVNDMMGHDAGNKVLKETAQRLSSLVKKDDIVARFSGDEFAILLLSEVVHEKAIFYSTLVADNIIKSLAKAFYMDRREVFIGSSIGISIFPDDGITSEELLKHADVAMYEAKHKGRNNYQFYKKEFSVASQDRLTMEQNLRKALHKGELQLFYQPQFYAQTRRVSGAEVLIRWITVDGQMISPERFIPLAEETGLIIEIGAWILETACCQLYEWLNQGYIIPQVSVNVSARQFMSDDFFESVEDALEVSGLDPKYLELEITESMLIGDLDVIELQLQRLKAMGIKIALDDFGTGYSSLSYLQKLPIDILKIDQAFIKELTVGSKDASIADAIIQMGHSLGQKIVAEGVENEAQLLFLTDKKCDYIQGYYFSKPLPVYKMTELLKTFND